MQNFMMTFTAQHVINLSRPKRRKFTISALTSSFEVRYNTLKVLEEDAQSSCSCTLTFYLGGISSRWRRENHLYQQLSLVYWFSFIPCSSLNVYAVSRKKHCLFWWRMQSHRGKGARSWGWSPLSTNVRTHVQPSHCLAGRGPQPKTFRSVLPVVYLLKWQDFVIGEQWWREKY